jgi:hypothetical protein
MSLRYVKHFDLNILRLADNLILHGNVFQRMAELYANDLFIIFVFGRITAKLLLDIRYMYIVKQCHLSALLI